MINTPTKAEPTPAMQTMQQFLDQFPVDEETGKPRKQHKGTFRSLREWFLGEKLNDVKVQDHAKFVSFLGKIIAPLLLISFSFATLNVLASSQFQQLGDMLQGARKWDFGLVSNIITTSLFVIGMDVLMLAAAILLRDMLFGNRKKSGRLIAGMSFLAVVIMAIGIIEGVTFYVMLTGNETVMQRTNALIQFLDIARSAFAPACAVLLVVIPQKTLTREDIDSFILAKTASAMLYQLEHLVIQGRASFARLLQLFLHFTLPDEDKAREKQEERDEKLNEIITDLQHDPRIAAMTKRVEDVEREHEAAQDLLQRELESAQSTIAAAKASVMRQVMAWLVEVIQSGMWPDELLAVAPEYGRIDPVTLLKGAGIRVKQGTIAAPKSASNSDTLEGILGDLGVEPAARPSRTLKDFLIKSSDIVKLSGDQLPSDEATKLAKELGNSRKEGVAYVAPLRRIIRALAARNQLHSALFAWYKAQQSGDNGEGIAEDIPSE